MGTNYYLVRNACECCGRGEDRLHIGKSSGGWCFSLNTHPDEDIQSLGDWQKLWSDPRHRIEDEYKSPVTPAEMMLIITDRKAKAPPKWTREEWIRNDAQLGPNNLLRGRVDGVHTIAHGDGTYDLCRGDFS